MHYNAFVYSGTPAPKIKQKIAQHPAQLAARMVAEVSEKREKTLSMAVVSSMKTICDEKCAI